MRKFRSNLHTHSVYSDGKNSMEDMVKAAIKSGFVSLGISDHAPAYYDNECSMKVEEVESYLKEIELLRDKYQGEIEIYKGIECDILDPFDRSALDYVIGSVHYLNDPSTNIKYCIDDTVENFKKAIAILVKGDVRLLIKKYFEVLEDMLISYKPDIVGHLDIFKKFNGDGSFFDENSSWYKKELENICEKVAKSQLIVEVNTGGIKRGYRKDPYPSKWALSVLKSLNVPLTLCSDAHTADGIDFFFEEMIDFLMSIGCRSLKMLKNGSFIDWEL